MKVSCVRVPKRCNHVLMGQTTIHLLRHGEVYNPDKILYGRLPGFRLSERGQQMAQVVADSLRADGRDIVGLVASPLQRAQETAAPITAAFGLEMREDARLIEADSKFEGTRIGAEPWRLLHPGRWPKLVNPFTPSWGEPYVNMVARVQSAVEDAREQFAGHEAVLVSHQLPVWVTRLAYENKRLWHNPRKRQCTVCSLTSLVFDDDGDLVGIEYSEPAAHLSKTLSAEGWSPK